MFRLVMLLVVVCVPLLSLASSPQNHSCLLIQPMVWDDNTVDVMSTLRALATVLVIVNKADDTENDQSLGWADVSASLSANYGVVIHASRHGASDLNGLIMGVYNDKDIRDAAMSLYPTGSAKYDDDDGQAVYGVIVPAGGWSYGGTGGLVYINTCFSNNVINAGFPGCGAGVGYDGAVGSDVASQDFLWFWTNFGNVMSSPSVSESISMSELACTASGDTDMVLCDSCAASSVHGFRVNGNVAYWDVERTDDTRSYIVEALVGGRWLDAGEVHRVCGGWNSAVLREHGELYRLVEISVDGSRIEHEQADASFSYRPYGDEDHGSVEVRHYSSSSPGKTESREDIVLICRQEFVESLAQQYMPLCQDEGYDVILHLYDESVDTKYSLREAIEAYANGGVRLFQIVGDASDAEMWEQPWPGGWSDRKSDYISQGYAETGQPQYDVIPTWFMETPELDPNESMEYFVPYSYSDISYLDFDGDGLPEQGLAIARMPAKYPLDVPLFINKLIEYYEWVPGAERAKVLALVGDSAHGTCAGGSSAYAVANAVEQEWSGSQIWDYLYESDGDTQEENNEAFVEAYNGNDYNVIHVSGNWSTRYRPGYFMDITVGDGAFYIGDLNETYGRYPLLYASTCGVADYARNEHPEYWTSVAERMLKYPGRGLVAVIGPTMGTMQSGNAVIGEKLSRALSMVGPDELVSVKVCDALRDVMVAAEPGGQLYRMAASTVLLMHVALKLPWQYERGSDPGSELVGGSFPNPGNPGTTVFYTSRPGEIVNVAIYDLRGRVIRCASVVSMRSGKCGYYWDGRCDDGRLAPSGQYVALIRVDEEERARAGISIVR